MNKLHKFFGLAIALSCLLIGNVRAVTISGDSVGVFVNPIAGVNPSMTVSGVGTSHFTWGVGLPDVSSLDYQNAAFSSTDETPFKIGTLTYHNGAISSGTGADGVNLSLDVSFTDPSGVTQNFVYGMQLINTANTTDPIASADYVILSTFPTATFNIGLTTYTLKLSFDDLTGGGFIQTGNQLHVLEGETATAALKGVVTTDLSGVPDVTSTVGLLGLAMACLVGLRRKMRS